MEDAASVLEMMWTTGHEDVHAHRALVRRDVTLSGRNGWTYRVEGSFARSSRYKTRDAAAVRCALS